jgi:hypothetical protein
MQRSDLKRYEFYAGPEQLGALWTLSRDTLTMRCTLATHRLGWELRLTTRTVLRSHVCNSEAEVFSVSDAWQGEAKQKGYA